MTIDRPTIGYDAGCRLCRRIASRIGPTLRRHGFAMRPLQDAELADALGVTAGTLPDEFQFLRPGRRPLGGAPAIAAIAALLGLQPVAWLVAVPAGMRVLRRCYRRLAARRRCRAGGCARHQRTQGCGRTAAPAWMDVFAARVMSGLNDPRRRAAL